MAKKNPEVTAFGEILNDTIKDLINITWINQDGSEKKLIDMTYDELQRAYFHVCDMLWNRAKFAPGKTVVKENIKKACDDCNAELLLRYLLHDLNAEVFKTNRDLIDYIMSIKKNNGLTDNDSVNELFDGINPVFNTVTIGKLMSACFDKLDVINRKMISDKFIIAQGIWLTNEEKEDLTEFDSEGKIRSYMDVIRERLFLGNVRLRINQKGLTYAEFRSLVKIEPFSKISSLPTTTLQLLRDKIFLLLDNDVDYHINKWTDIKTNLEKVAEYKHFMLKEKKY